ncbi:MAG: 30S ribosomal protein S4, partial [Candidatus Marinimicrobia bacterium]|nr:30S ribosomal protein S4 [Candidatus Neomarinimicrobiota bacterium]
PVFESPKFTQPRRNYPPGQHGPSRRKRISDFGVQLREKQRMKYLYGVLEKQFRNYYKKAVQKEGPTGQNLFIALESRFDNTVYRLGFAPTRASARQLVSHRHFLVNEKTVNIPSFQMKPGDVIEVRDKSKKLEIIHDSMKRVKGDPYPWLSIDKANMKGVFSESPKREDIPEEINEQLIVELYSK